MEDTIGAGLDRYHELLRAQEPYQRAAQTVRLSRMVRDLAVAGIRERHPRASAEEIRIRLTVRLYGRDAAERLFADVPADAV
jgi:hypothetical protein